MKPVLFFIAMIFAISCSQKAKYIEGKSEQIVLRTTMAGHIEASFKSRDINGCFILHDMQADTSIIYNTARAEQPFLPASTFKILNSLIALECEAVKDEREVFKWDGKTRQISVWNQDHNMKTGIKYSVVWFYQELARRIGKERMQAYVDSVAYGNRKTGKHIDDFWLVGDLRITPKQQVEFLKLLINEELPFQDKNIAIVKEILIEDRNDRYIFRAKTGWAEYGTPVGWYVGYIQFQDQTFIFVNNLEIRNNEDAKARKLITKEIFKQAFDIDLKI